MQSVYDTLGDPGKSGEYAGYQPLPPTQTSSTPDDAYMQPVTDAAMEDKDDKYMQPVTDVATEDKDDKYMEPVTDVATEDKDDNCLLYTSPSPRDS